jgi:Leucine-rich repeat (LRR) protein
LTLSNNDKIKFLPSKVAENFPNLLGYRASGCGIKKISKQDFTGLSKLKWLFLSRNEIEVIKEDTFQEVKNLEFLTLCKIFLPSVISCHFKIPLY